MSIKAEVQSEIDEVPCGALPPIGTAHSFT